MARTREENEAIILDAIRSGHTRTAAFSHAGISKATYHRWLKDPRFAHQVKVALQEYEDKRQNILKDEIQAARDYLRAVLSRQVYQTSITEYRDSQGNVVRSLVKRVQVMPSDWYLQHLLSEDGEDTKETLKVQVSVSQPQERSAEQMEADEDSWIDPDQDNYDEFDDDGNSDQEED